MKRKKFAYTLLYNVLEKVLELFKKEPEIFKFLTFKVFSDSFLISDLGGLGVISKNIEKRLKSGKFEKIRRLLL